MPLKGLLKAFKGLFEEGLSESDASHSLSSESCQGPLKASTDLLKAIQRPLKVLFKAFIGL